MRRFSLKPTRIVITRSQVQIRAFENYFESAVRDFMNGNPKNIEKNLLSEKQQFALSLTVGFCANAQVFLPEVA